MLRRLYDWTMDKAAHRHAEGWLAFISFIEASFFPIPPHPLLGLMCLAEPNKAIRFAAVATIASVLGGLFGYAIGYFLYESVGAWLLGVLGLAEEFPVAACRLNENAFAVIFLAGATPIPFKLLTITAGFVEMNLAAFVVAAIAGRALIFMTVGVLFRVFGAPIKRMIDKYLVSLTTLFAALVVGGFIALGTLGGGDKQEGSEGTCASATLEDVR